MSWQESGVKLVKPCPCANNNMQPNFVASAHSQSFLTSNTRSYTEGHDKNLYWKRKEQNFWPGTLKEVHHRLPGNYIQIVDLFLRDTFQTGDCFHIKLLSLWSVWGYSDRVIKVIKRNIIKKNFNLYFVLKFWGQIRDFKIRAWTYRDERCHRKIIYYPNNLNGYKRRKKIQWET